MLDCFIGGFTKNMTPAIITNACRKYPFDGSYPTQLLRDQIPTKFY